MKSFSFCCFTSIIRSSSMEIIISVEHINLAFSLFFIMWGLLETTWRRRYNGDYSDLRYELGEQKSTIFTKITVLCNAAVSIMYVGFCFYQYFKVNLVEFRSIFTSLNWVLTTAIVLVYLKKKNCSENNKRWPFVLVLWWVFSCVLYSLSISIHFIDLKKSKSKSKSSSSFPFLFHNPNFADFASLPFTILLCFNSLPIACTKKFHEIEHPLLQKVEECNSVYDNFGNAGLWSKLTFRWLNPLFKLGRSRKLELHHIPALPESETADNASLLLEESFQKHKTKASSLPRAIFMAVWRSLAVNAIYAGFNTLASYLGPYLITNFVNYLTGEEDYSSYQYGLVLAFIFFFAKTVESLSQRQWYFGAQRIGVRIRSALMVLIYKKSISIKYGGPSNGSIVNYINVDVERVGDFCMHIHGVWLLPIQVTLALVILYKNLGAAPSLAALFATVLVIVINTPLANRQEKLHSKIMEAKDSRVKATSESLKNMRVLKLHSWESTYMKKIFELRETEASWLKRYLYTCSAVAFLFWASPTLVSVVTFGVCITMKTPLTSGTVLSALATFRILQEPIYNLPELISMVTQTKVSIDRIQEFVKEDDEKILPPCHTSKSLKTAIKIEIGEYAWAANHLNMKNPAIKISTKLKILTSYKVAICGSVGSGKSSFICSILGEIPRVSGFKIEVTGSKAYVPQSAWIQTGTIRENVLFGKAMNKAFYDGVLEACALNRDIEMWADGDLTVVGERGMNLSGGQKQRIQLARAVYSDSDVYFLDDPFSAVDAHTGAHLFKRCLMELLALKTVIYVTHQLEFMEAADLVLVMKEGMIVQSGKYEELIADRDGELVRHMAAHTQSLDQVQTFQETSTSPKKDKKNEVIEEHWCDPISTCRLSDKSHEEKAETGRVKWHVYSTFTTCAYKGALVPVILLCQVLFQGLQMGSNYWIAWATEEENRVSQRRLIWIFALLSGVSSVFILGRAVFLTTIAIETAQHLFHSMTRSVFRAPISFFDCTPSSRILNRSSTDQSVIDTDIPYRLAGLAFSLIQLFSIVILMSQVAWPVFLLFLVIFAISVWYQVYYITTARELARMVGIRKAPILHHFSESVTGAATIRCFNKEDLFLMKNVDFIDDYSRIAFHNSATMEWLCVRINFLFNLVFFLVLIILVSLPRSAIHPSMAGLVATYGLNLSILQAWVIWNLCNVENKMISVERILQFTNLQREAPLVIQESRPIPEWPINGVIELENLHVQYNPALPMILKGITCTFPGEKKIGIVGRTGSGKSTLIQALFRVVEPSYGRILIDGIDVCKIGLQDLRSRLSIIPQDPTLFQGTVRNNLDPLEQHSDQQIWEVLNKCRLANIVQQDQRLLDATVAEDGENWSLGQRQLVCLARVMLQRRRILVLDEATASVDTATDNLIQKTIREETTCCTVITVAHRIPTVIDNDLVLVLDDGKVIEYNSPTRLLNDKSSAFSKLVMEFLNRSTTNSYH